MTIEKKKSNGDSVDIRLRKAFGAWLAMEKQKNPQLFSFLEEEEDTQILKGLMIRSRNAKRKRQEEESTSIELPKPFKEKVQELKGCEVSFLMQKKLSDSDLNPVLNHGSFSINIADKNNFLIEKEENKTLAGMHVIVLDPSLRECNMCFKKCPIRSHFYNLTNGWNQIVLQNDLKLNDTLQLWSFRVSCLLWFALVKL